MKSTRLATWLLGGLCALAASSCNYKNNEPDPVPATENTIQVGYGGTYCADPWGRTTSEQQLAAAVATYLAQHGVTSYQQQSITHVTAAACAACTCKTGVMVLGTVKESQLPAALALGLTKW